MGGGLTQKRSIVSEVVDDKVEDSYDKETSDEVEEAFQNDQMLGSETELILRDWKRVSYLILQTS